jgi:hypothetical protein
LLADSHDIQTKWKNFVYRLLNVHGVSDVRQTDRHTHTHISELLVLESSPLWIGIVIADFKRYKLLSILQFPAELIQAGGETLRSEIHRLVNLIFS